MQSYFTELQNAEALRAAESVVASGQAILLCGPPASGKTALISYLAAKFGAKPPIPLHLTSAQDTRDLLGSYVMTNKPGEFKFIYGPLTYAIQSGRWISIEEITSISQDSLLLLASILNTRTLTVGSQRLAMHPDFCICANTTTDPSSLSTTIRSMFYPIVLPPIGSNLKQILTKHCHGSIATILAHLHQLFELSRLTMGRVSVADMVRWAKRISLDIVHGAITLNRNVQEAPPSMSTPTLISLLDDNFRMAVIKNAWEAFILRHSRAQLREDFLGILRVALSMHHELILSTLTKVQVEVRQDYARKLLVCGRVSLPFYGTPDEHAFNSICRTHHTTRLLEIIASSIRASEPLLLVGPTGIGKTTCLQIVARALGKRLHVVNMSSQTDTADLLGGYVPTTLEHILKNLYDAITGSLSLYISVKKNQEFIVQLHKAYAEKDTPRFLQHCESALAGIRQVLQKESEEGNAVADGGAQVRQNEKADKKRLRRGTHENSLYFLENTKSTLEQAAALYKFIHRSDEKTRPTMTFNYQEGLLVRALVQGDWILIDEINLASYDLLDVISQLVNPEHDEIAIPDKGFLAKNPNFRVFASMNPGSDVGKKDLPPSIRRCFTEVYVDEMADEVDIVGLTKAYLHMGEAGTADRDISGLHAGTIYEIFSTLKIKARTELVTAAGAKCPCFSLRSLCRALTFAHRFRGAGGLRRSLYEGFMLTFGSVLSEHSRRAVHVLLVDKLFNGNKEFLMNPFTVQPLDALETKMVFQAPSKEELAIVKYIDPPVRHGFLEAKPDENHGSDYVLTKSTHAYMTTISRAIAAQLPILLEGTTSSGKTSLIRHIAKQFGYQVVRINNHEHTDLSEYFGSYQPDQATGQLVFRDGPLVTAMKCGYWVILDELNMASSEILEALNRLLDENKELLVPETQEIVKPAPGFLLFATQNPSGSYAGRKALSEAFQNRFITIEFSDITTEELREILTNRITSRHLAPQYCRKLIETVQTIRTQLGHRNNNAIVANTLVTLRDLFRIADRLPRTLTELAMAIFELIGERQREHADKKLIAEIIAKRLELRDFSIEFAEQEYAKRVQPIQSMIASALKQSVGGHQSSFLVKFRDIVWTPSMVRLFALLFTSISNGESPLLVGVSGAGKTTSVELIAAILAQKLVQINLHKHTESADFIGSLRPLRSRETLNASLSTLRKYAASTDSVEQSVHVEINRLEAALKSKLFEWEDGPVLSCMKRGHILLLDEVSLADESVLERLNSVLETSRELTVAENPNMIKPIIAHTGFKIIATMNPSGDYGKKELSPAMRSRLTEFWMPHIRDIHEVELILTKKLQGTAVCDLAQRVDLDIVSLLISFFSEMDRVIQEGRLGDVFTISIRDILAVCDYISEVELGSDVDIGKVLMDAVTLSILDGLPVRTQLGNTLACREVKQEMLILFDRHISSARMADIDSIDTISVCVSESDGMLRFFQEPEHVLLASIPPGPQYNHATALAHMEAFRLDAPTTTHNACKLAMAMRFQRPVLLEGDPGVGKSALISAIATICGYPLVRINFSEQTDLSDLVGADLPAEGGFHWVDGVLLKAVKQGAFILLDELNLANQTVLEGLNSLLDHRKSLFIPELMLSVKAPPTLRIFGTQNPRTQGGGRKGLPQSFINRFLNVYIDVLKDEDYDWILHKLFSSIPAYVLDYVLTFTKKLRSSITNLQLGATGGPWELNVRDMLRLCDFLTTTPSIADDITLVHAKHYGHILFGYRFRTQADEQCVQSILADRQLLDMANASYSREAYQTYTLRPLWNVTDSTVRIGALTLPRVDPVFQECIGINLSCAHPSCFLTAQLLALEALALAVTQNLSCVLVGAPETGKSSILRTLADVTRQPLILIAASTATDVSDLIGSYEQVNVLYDLREVLHDIRLYISSAGVKNTYPSMQFTEYLVEFTDSLEKAVGSNAAGKEPSVSVKRIVSAASHQLFVEFAKRFATATDVTDLMESNFELFCTELCREKPEPVTEELGPHLPTPEEILYNLAALHLSAQKSQTGRFVWRDSEFIRALERGYWVELTNANFCMPSVLDRLNSLLERGGGLEILEQSLEETRSVRVHPNFRLFITYTPVSDISRALRNRSLEVSIDTQVSRYNIVDIVRFVRVNEVASRVTLGPFLVKFVALTYFGISLQSIEIVGLGSLLKWLTLLLSYHKRFPASVSSVSAVSSWLYRSFCSVFVASTISLDMHRCYTQIYRDVHAALQEGAPLENQTMADALAVLQQLNLASIDRLSSNNSLQHSLALLELRTERKLEAASMEHVNEPFVLTIGRLAICVSHAREFHNYTDLVPSLLKLTDIDSYYLLNLPEEGSHTLLQHLARGYVGADQQSVLNTALQHVAKMVPFYAALINLFVEKKFAIGNFYLYVHLVEIAQYVASDPGSHHWIALFYSLFELLISYSPDKSTVSYSFEQRQSLRALLDIVLTDPHFKTMPRLLNGYIRSLFITASHNEAEVAWLSVRRNLMFARLSVHYLPALFEAFQETVRKLDLCATAEGTFCLHAGLADRMVMTLCADILASIMYMACQVGEASENYAQKLEILRGSENRIQLVVPNLYKAEHPAAKALQKVDFVLRFLSRESFTAKVSGTLMSWGSKSPVMRTVALLFDSLGLYHQNRSGPVTYLQGPLFTTLSRFVLKSLTASALLADTVETHAFDILGSLLSRSNDYLFAMHRSIKSIALTSTELLYRAFGRAMPLASENTDVSRVTNVIGLIVDSANPLLVTLTPSLLEIASMLKVAGQDIDPLLIEGIGLAIVSISLYQLISVANQRDPIVVARFRAELYRHLTTMIAQTIGDSQLHSLFVFGDSSLYEMISLNKELQAAYQSYQRATEEYKVLVLVRDDDIDNTFFEDLSSQLAGLDGFAAHIGELICAALKLATELQGSADHGYVTADLEAILLKERQFSTNLAILLPRLLNYNKENSYYLDITVPIAAFLVTLRASLAVTVSVLHSQVREFVDAATSESIAETGVRLSFPAMLHTIQRTITGCGDEFLDFICYDKFVRLVNATETQHTAPISRLFMLSLVRYGSYFRQNQGLTSLSLLRDILRPERLASVAAQFEIEESKNYRKYIDEHSMFKTRNQSSTAEDADEEDELKQQIALLFPKSNEYFVKTDKDEDDGAKKRSSNLQPNYIDCYASSFLTGMSMILAIGNCILHLYTADTNPLPLQDRLSSLNVLLQNQVPCASHPLVALQAAFQAFQTCEDKYSSRIYGMSPLTLRTDAAIYPLLVSATSGLVKVLSSRSPNVDYSKLQTGKTRRSIHCKDIYYFPYPYETTEFCSTLLRKIVARTESLLAEWPNNIQLLDIRQVCDRILDLPVLETPLVMFLTGAEVLVRFMETWDKGAPAVYKYVVTPNVPVPESLTKELTRLIVMWRRIELMSWNGFFTRVHTQFTNVALTYWPELLIACLAHQRSVAQGEPATEAFYSQLRDFLFNSNIGEFSIRLSLLFALSELVSKIDELVEPRFIHSVHRNTTAAILFALASEAEAFAQHMQTAFAAETAQVKSRFEDQIRIFEWNERSSYTSWASVQSSHRLCVKIIREYTEMLQRAVRSVYMVYSSIYDRIPPALTVKEHLPLSSEHGLLDFGASEHLIGRLNYCVEQMCYGRRETETLNRNEKGRILADVLAVLRETLGCDLLTGFSFEQSSGWKLAQLQLPSVHAAFELINTFHQALHQRCSEVEAHDVEKMKRLADCTNKLLVELAALFASVTSIDVIYHTMGLTAQPETGAAAHALYVVLADRSVPENLLLQTRLSIHTAYKMCISLQEFLRSLPEKACDMSPEKLCKQVALFMDNFAAKSRTALDKISAFSELSVALEHRGCPVIVPLVFFLEAQAILRYILAKLPPLFNDLANVKAGAPTSAFAVEYTQYFVKVRSLLDLITDQIKQCTHRGVKVDIPTWPMFSLPMFVKIDANLPIETIVHDAHDHITAHTEALAANVIGPIIHHSKCHVIALPIPPPELQTQAQTLQADVRALADILSQFMTVLIAGAIAILRTGFHSKTDDEQEQREENDNQSGMGLGDGTGTQNVSKEAAKELCEDDLMGNQNEQDNNQQEDNNGDDDEDCIDMKNDFGGLSDSMHRDIQEESSEDGEEEELEKEMGSDQGEEIDERNFNNDDNSAEEYSDDKKKNTNNNRDTMEFGAQDEENQSSAHDDDKSGESGIDQEEQNEDTKSQGSEEPQEDLNDLDDKNVSGQSDLSVSDRPEEAEEVEEAEEKLGEADQQTSDVSDPDQEERGVENTDNQELPTSDEEAEDREEHEAAVDIDNSEASNEQDAAQDDEAINISAQQQGQQEEDELQQDVEQNEELSESSNLDANNVGANDKKQMQGDDSQQSVDNASDQWDAESTENSAGAGAESAELKEGNPDLSLDEFQRIWRERMNFKDKSEKNEATESQQASIQSSKTVEFDDSKLGHYGALGLSETKFNNMTNQNFDSANGDQDFEKKGQEDKTKQKEDSTDPEQATEPEVTSEEENSEDAQEPETNTVSCIRESAKDLLDGPNEPSGEVEAPLLRKNTQINAEDLASAIARGQQMLVELNKKTSAAAFSLAERLRIILEPTVTSDLKGDFRTGKKLNLRRIIPFIASDFRKDKIWLRRSKPSKRVYQVLLAVDDSSSMASIAAYALQAITLLFNACKFLEVGQLGVMSFGQTFDILLPISDQYSDSSLAQALGSFTFAQNETRISDAISVASEYLDSVRFLKSNNSAIQLILIISDGRIKEKSGVAREIRKCAGKNQLPVLIVLDTDKKSIMDIKSVGFVTDASGKKVVQTSMYLDDFPFQCYALLRKIEELPETLVAVIQRWIESVAVYNST